MPIYEYVCQKCGQSFELLIRGKEKPQCPHCGSKKLEKQFSAPAVGKSSKGRSSSFPAPT